MTHTLHFKIKGMHCVSCASQIESSISFIKGVEHARVNFMNEKATVAVETFSPTLTKEILQAIQDQGYEGESLDAPHKQSGDSPQAPHHESHGGVSPTDLVLAILFSLPLIGHMLGFHVSPYIQLLCASVVQFWAGRRFYKASWYSLKNRMANMDLLVTLGATAAYSYSFVAILLNRQDLYFEAGAIVITLVLVGRFLEDRAKKAANAAVRSLMALTPPMALVEREGVYQNLPSHEIKKGDHIMVRAWQRIPIDGTIFQGVSEVDESMITGESMPVVKQQGDHVIGGTTNTTGVLYLQATAVGSESTLSRMIRLIEEAQSSHPPIQKFVDQVSAVFVPSVLVISLLTFGAWIIIGDSFQQALLVAISVLVIACPCALGLATPTAIVVAMGVGAKKGLLIKNLETLEALRKVDLVVFDKTGTLTRGKFNLTFLETLSSVPKKQVLALSAALQKGSEHPLAKAFLTAFKQKKFFPVKEFVSFPGKGLQGEIKGTTYYLGSEKFMAEHNLTVPRTTKSGQTDVYLATENELLAHFRLADVPRKKAFETLKTLKEMGLKTVMLTGDNKETALDIGQKVGIDEVFPQLQPKDKVNYVKAQEYQHHHIAMVGDGINDAPALAAATVGFALGSGTDVAIDAAPITLMRPDLNLIPQAFHLSNKVFRIIQENLFWAFIFNVIGIAFAVFGLLRPEIAGAAMAASSLLVVMNSLRLKWS